MAKKLRNYPAAERVRTGCKVGWRYYKRKAEAKKAATAAKHNAPILEAQGYDFGYQSPGTIRYMDKGEYAGLYEVCIP